METIIRNQQAVQLVMQWDPFGYGSDSYDTEAADVVAALQSTNDADELAAIIQSVYEHSFEQWITLDACKKLAQQLLAIKQDGSCAI